MRLTAVLLLAASLHVTARTEGQNVTLKFNNAPMKEVLREIQRQTGLNIMVGEELLDKTGLVTIDIVDKPVQEALALCFQKEALSFSITDGRIILKPIPNAEILSLLPIPEIKGRVTNDKGEPLANANVVVKRTRRGAVTDANGAFTLHNITTEDTIQISFIGYKTQTIPIHDRTNLTLVMQPATNELDKMVVQAYGQTSQRLATGNIGVVRSEDIAKQPVMNVLEAMQGHIAGVVVTNTTGLASGAVKVEIRGRNTLNDFPSDPLYVVDGVPLTILDVNAGASGYNQGSMGAIQSGIPSPANGQSPLLSINPNDIESIEVLKDADATALYGSRASNGVILVTTKKGKAGQTHADISVYTGYSKTPRYYDMLNTQQYLAMRREALANDNLPVDINNAPDLVGWDTTRYTDWQRYSFGGIGKVVDAQSSISGGNAYTTFRASTAYHYQRDILIRGGGNKRGSFSLNLNHRSLNQKLSISWTNSYSVSSADLIETPLAVFLPPNAPSVYDTKGNLNYLGWTPLSNLYSFGSLLQPYSSSTNFLTSNFVIGYEILKGLNIKANLGYNNGLSSQVYTTPIASLDPTTQQRGTANFGSTNFRNYILEPQLEYKSYIGKGKLDMLGGSTYQTNQTTAFLNIGRNYKNDALLGSINNAPTQIAYNNFATYKYAGVFARLNYELNEKYIFNINARRDGSSKFGPGRRYGNFGSVGAAWIFSEEKWIRGHFDWLSFGKIRGSYGLTGGDQIGDYSYLSLWTFLRGLYNGVNTLMPTGHTDSLLQWQVNKKLELTLDLGFLKDRLNIEATWYRDRCDNQLVGFPTPTFTGFGTVTANSPANVQNTGLEFDLSAKIIDKKDWKWNTKFNIGINHNKLLSYPNLAQSPFYAASYVVGKPLNIQRFLHYTGVDPQTGDYTFEDINKDGHVTLDFTNRTPDDRYIVDMTPKYDGGFTNDISYKNISLSLFFYFKKQKGYSSTNAIAPPGTLANQSTKVLRRWQKPGDITDVARFTTITSDNWNYFELSDAQITDASFIRLQNIMLSYEFPGRWKSKMGVSGLRFYLQGQNLFIITKYDGPDPEIQTFGGLPKPRILTAGISCNF